MDPQLLTFLMPCCLALQMRDRGRATEIMATCGAEVDRPRDSAAWYLRQLRHELLAGAKAA